MTACDSESRHPIDGVAWTAPDPIPSVIETPRLTVRAFEADDADQLFDAINADRDTLYPWVQWARDDHRHRDRTLQFIMDNRVALREPAKLQAVTLGVFERETGALVGGHGIHGVRTHTAGAETGYWLAASARGKGYAGEATRHVISWCLRPHDDGGLGLHRVYLYVSHKNTDSIRVAENLGIRKEVEQRDDLFVDGFGLTDRLGWGVTKDEWDTEMHRPALPA